MQSVETGDLVNVLEPRTETRPSCQSGTTAVDSHHRFNAPHSSRVAALCMNVRAAQLGGDGLRHVALPLVDTRTASKRAGVGHTRGTMVLASVLLQ